MSGDNGRSWTHTFTGVMNDDLVSGQYVDHPPGGARGFGNISVKIISNNRLEKIMGTGRNFGGNVWTR